MFQCDAEPILSQESQAKEKGVYITRLALAGRDCRAQLDTVENHLEINGVVITDTLVKTQKKKKRFGVF
ncbi:MAG: hypothetical protein COA43_11275 [Robiginitomaculum sp.]|nr:MAG: hypothetical protein COA43_11275 [Robiginitomaculum sp.]